MTLTGRYFLPGAMACLILALSPEPARAGPKTDVIVMKNGDRVTCEVQEIKRGMVTVKTDDMGTLNIEQDKIASVTANITFEVEDLAGGQYFGVLEPGPNPGDLKVHTSTGPQIVPLPQVVQATRLEATFWQRLDGSIDVGSTYTSANSLLQFNFDLTVTMERPKHQTTLNATSTLSKQPDVEDTKRTSVSLDYVRRRKNHWLDFASAVGEANPEIGLDLRGLAALGLGRSLVRSPNTDLSAGVGPDINLERSLEGVNSTNAEATAYVTYNRYSYDFPKIDITISLNGYAGLTDWGRTRFEGDAKFKKELLKDYYITLRGYDSYDSDPPTADVVHNDYGYTFALGWSW